jgi:hypothetical protein
LGQDENCPVDPVPQRHDAIAEHDDGVVLGIEVKATNATLGNLRKAMTGRVGHSRPRGQGPWPLASETMPCVK